MQTKYFLILGLFSLTLSLGSCKKANLFSVNEDVRLGKQVSDQIAASPSEFPVLPKQSNREAYAALEKIKSKLMNTGRVKYKDRFAWKLAIIHDDKTLNAFATPGGYIYVYTGLIKFLDNEAQLAGVLGHEIGHSDLRHSTRQMTKSYGLSVLLEASLGNQQAIKDVAGGLLSLKFSRNHETEADEFSVMCMCRTDYPADGAAGFFRKIGSQGGAKPPVFMSTHPDPGNRVQKIEQKARELGCRGKNTYAADYARLKQILPQ